MNLQEIQAAVNEGKTVHWKSEIYVVHKDDIGQWHILCTSNQSCIGLTHKDGKTMNGKPEDFYIQTPACSM